MRYRQRIIGRAVALALLAALAAGCAFSPEDGRARGGGSGASSSNYPQGGVVPKSKVFSHVEP